MKVRIAKFRTLICLIKTLDAFESECFGTSLRALKVTVKARGLCSNKSSPGKTSKPIDIKQIEDE